ncbi:MAG: radical SAM family heme chaperone HemW [Sulfurovum sp.]|nr:radical SAM family heme chaperone HemW [Sulfurovum sp.]MCB4744772.1 radical SAM family heme chaperone HemW [Sulfurovum sp.]MCB4745778.1 radical SAM family heme chaperone HemW [Sulfurovum sp.]MCB4748451.1 radical SAM family heme chaperone HemW [Sulfurovum sp.]MCB4751025.1 radical SAM family heme chaperone HemW [Sulfurovum sp.]
MLTYIHIPYCDSKCHYCSFNSYVDKFDTRHAYMQALHRQLVYELEYFEATKGCIETLFIGGGTPSTVDPSLYEPIFELLSDYLQNGAEITTEANPNSATKAWLSGMKALGVNRISFGAQSFHADKLKALNRAHSPIQTKEAIFTAKALGFEHLSLDLIYNYYGDTKILLGKDINEAFGLPIDHISAYELTIENNTKFKATPEVRQEDDSLAFFIAEEITRHGFEHYEISNFGTYQSKHNRGYWELKDYIGAGAGAVGFKYLTSDDAIRFYPQTDIEAYIANPLKITKESLKLKELLTEKIFLGLRSNVGIQKSILPEKIKEKVNMLVKERKLTETTTHYYNTNFFIADTLTLYLLE